MRSLKIGEKIRQIRKTKKLSMKDLARKVGVSFSYIAKMETGQNRINVEVLSKIAKALRVPLDSLLSQNSESSPFDEDQPGWYSLKDFFIVTYDDRGRPESADYEIHNREANVIGQLRELQEKYPDMAEAIFHKFESFAKEKDPAVFTEWKTTSNGKGRLKKSKGE